MDSPDSDALTGEKISRYVDFRFQISPFQISPFIASHIAAVNQKELRDAESAKGQFQNALKFLHQWG